MGEHLCKSGPLHNETPGEYMERITGPDAIDLAMEGRLRGKTTSPKKWMAARLRRRQWNLLCHETQRKHRNIETSTRLAAYILDAMRDGISPDVARSRVDEIAREEAATMTLRTRTRDVIQRLTKNDTITFYQLLERL